MPLHDISAESASRFMKFILQKNISISLTLIFNSKEGENEISTYFPYGTTEMF